jgi:PIN domain nuclease of toxin-antitoxin system
VIVVDTHVLLWIVSDEKKLGRRTRSALDRAWKSGAVGASAVSFWEVAVLQARRRIRMSLRVDEWRRSLLSAGLIEFPLDGGIAIRAAELAGLPADPADRFIVATAIGRRATLMTADEAILGWQHVVERQDARI